MKVTFTRSDVARLLKLPDTQAVEDLISERILDISCYTVTGRPLFDMDEVRRAANHVATRREEAAPSEPRSDA